MNRARLSAWHTAVFSALGIGSFVNCGGVSQRSDEPNGSDAGNAGVPAPGGVGGTAGSSRGGAGGTAGTAPDFLSCDNPTPVVLESEAFGGQGGQMELVETGYVQCADGWLHRSEKRECPSYLPRTGGVVDVPGDCRSNADCTERPEGRCLVTSASSYCGPPPAPPRASYCSYGCTRDEHCSAGKVCLCGIPTGRCVPSDCATDADCNGRWCASYGEGAVVSGFACQTPRDTCMTNADCTGATCALGNERFCAPQGAGGTCGRPFLVAGEARSADALGGSDGWIRAANPDVRKLSSAARARLAEYWTGMARLEHGSVAAFARFTLELVSLGAPAELVEASQRAMGDEIEHARLCFGLASAYAGRAIGPGPLAVEGALDDRSFETIVRTAILEACVGETLAAVEAEDAAERATDPEVRRVLALIAVDEARHAELGFRFLAWALARAEPELRARLSGASPGRFARSSPRATRPLRAGTPVWRSTARRRPRNAAGCGSSPCARSWNRLRVRSRLPPAFGRRPPRSPPAREPETFFRTDGS